MIFKLSFLICCSIIRNIKKQTRIPTYIYRIIIENSSYFFTHARILADYSSYHSTWHHIWHQNFCHHLKFLFIFYIFVSITPRSSKYFIPVNKVRIKQIFYFISKAKITCFNAFIGKNYII